MICSCAVILRYNVIDAVEHESRYKKWGGGKN
jgi:hypothetical protein